MTITHNIHVRCKLKLTLKQEHNMGYELLSLSLSQNMVIDPFNKHVSTSLGTAHIALRILVGPQVRRVSYGRRLGPLRSSSASAAT